MDVVGIESREPLGSGGTCGRKAPGRQQRLGCSSTWEGRPCMCEQVQQLASLATFYFLNITLCAEETLLGMSPHPLVPARAPTLKLRRRIFGVHTSGHDG